MAAEAKYRIGVNDATKGPLNDISRGFKRMDVDIKRTSASIRGFGAVIGVGAIAAGFKAIIGNTAAAEGANSRFVKSLDAVKEGFNDLLTLKSGLPGATQGFEDLAKSMNDPALEQAFDVLTDKFVNLGITIGKFAVDGAAAFAWIGGFGRDEMVELDNRIEEIRRLQKSIAGPGAIPLRGGGGAAGRAGQQDRLRQLRAEEQMLLAQQRMMQDFKLFKPDVDMPKVGIVTDDDVKATKDAYDKMRTEADAFNSWVNDLNDGALEHFMERQYEMDTYRKQLNPQVEAEMQKHFQELEEMSSKMSDGMSIYSEQAARNMQDSFAAFLFDPFEDGVKGMLKGFVDAIRQMVAQRAAAQIFDMIGGGATGGFAGMLGSLFGGGKANGGPVQGGMSYLVGERGPEIVTLGASGHVTPNDKLGGQVVNYAPVFNFGTNVDKAEQVRFAKQIRQQTVVDISTMIKRGTFS